MKQIHDKEFEALIAMPAPERYALFVRRVVDWQIVWSLRSPNGWTLMGDDNGTEVVPVWPHERFAHTCADLKKHETAMAIDLDDWLEKWLPGMSKDRRQVAVFPVPNGKGVVISPEQLKSDLLLERDQYD